MTHIKKSNKPSQKVLLKIGKAIIINQLCLEANEDLREHKVIYKQQLKGYINSLNNLLDKHVTKEYSLVYMEDNSVVDNYTKQIEQFIEWGASMRFDKLTAAIQFAQEMDIDPLACKEFLDNQKLKETQKG